MSPKNRLIGYVLLCYAIVASAISTCVGVLVAACITIPGLTPGETCGAIAVPLDVLFGVAAALFFAAASDELARRRTCRNHPQTEEDRGRPMTETIPKPELDEQHKHRDLTHAEWAAEAKARFGENGLDWAFTCPICGDVATARDFPAGLRERVGQECVGRHRGALEGEPGPRGTGSATRGCNWAAYGLFPGPWAVAMPDGGPVVRMFALAPAPSQAPQSALRDPDGTPGPESAENPAAPGSAPARTLTVERQTPRRHGHAILDLNDLTGWRYRIALGDDQSVLAFCHPGLETPAFFAHAPADTVALYGLPGAFDEALAYIRDHALPVTPAELHEAFALIVEMIGADTARRLDAKAPWLPMDEAPNDGTEIIGLINGDEVPIRWNDEDRHCAGTGVARGAGYGFGPGWEDTWNNYAVIDDVEGWRPVEPGTGSEA